MLGTFKKEGEKLQKRVRALEEEKVGGRVRVGARDRERRAGYFDRWSQPGCASTAFLTTFILTTGGAQCRVCGGLFLV
jgi:hypothetical protein